MAGLPAALSRSLAAVVGDGVEFASTVADVVAEVDPGAKVVTFGHVADGNVHVNVVPAAAADGRHEDAVFGFVASRASGQMAHTYHMSLTRTY